MSRLLSPAWAASLSLTLLTACGLNPASVLVRAEIPAVLLACQDQPEPPAPLRDDSDLAYYILDLASAGADCRDKLARVNGLLNQPK